MIRRIIRGVAAAVLLFFVPVAAAQAYPAPDLGSFTVSTTTPTVGVPFTVTATGLGEATEATLTITSTDDDIPDSAIEIAGTASVTKAVVDGEVVFTVTLNEPGEYTIVITTDTGGIGTQVVTAVEAAAGGGGGGTLPGTGVSGTVLFGSIAGGLLVLGAVALFFVRRSRSQGTAA